MAGHIIQRSIPLAFVEAVAMHTVPSRNKEKYHIKLTRCQIGKPDNIWLFLGLKSHILETESTEAPRFKN